MKRAKKVSCALLLLTMLSGCGCQKQEPLAVVVERVEVTSQHGAETLERTYTKSVKMKAILNYLRWLRPQFGADCDPEQIPGDLSAKNQRLSAKKRGQMGKHRPGEGNYALRNHLPNGKRCGIDGQRAEASSRQGTRPR